MSIRVFNNAVINGTTIGVKNFVDGSGVITITGNDATITTINKAIHNWRGCEYSTAEFQTYGNFLSLNTSTTFGGLNTFYLDSTSVSSFYGIVTTEYDSDLNISTVTVRGESNDA